MENLPRNEVVPVKPIAPYIGGKRNLSRRLVELIRTVPHGCYAEPFVGMGGVFFRRDRRPSSEVINDISTDVATLFRILQRHYQAFLEMIRWQLSTRADFERLLATDATTLTDLERAARFLYLQRTGFGGVVHNRSFGVSVTNPARFDLTKLVPMLEDVHSRLSGVTIERLPWATFIARYDRPETLFFLDPPYWGNETDYGPGVFGREDFAQMRQVLGAIRGKFILTINDKPEVRALFEGFEIEPVRVSYGISKSAATEARELIITRI